jgi:hypothetical protein
MDWTFGKLALRGQDAQPLIGQAFRKHRTDTGSDGSAAGGRSQCGIYPESLISLAVTKPWSSHYKPLCIQC